MHEIVAYNKMAKEDRFGRSKILEDGNVASRILPAKFMKLICFMLALMKIEWQQYKANL